MVRAKDIGIKIHGSTQVKVYYNEDGSPVRRKTPKQKMDKKERRATRKCLRCGHWMPDIGCEENRESSKACGLYKENKND